MKKSIIIVLEGLKPAFVIVSIGIIFVLLTYWTDRNLDFWCTYFSGHDINVPAWISFLVTIIGRKVIVCSNIVSEIIRFFIQM